MPPTSEKSSHPPPSISPRTAPDDFLEPIIEYVEEEVYVPTERFLKSASNFPPVRTRRRYHPHHPAFGSSTPSTRGTPSPSSSSSRGAAPGAMSMPSLIGGAETHGLRRTYGMCEAEFEELNRKFVGLGRAGRALSADPDLWKGRGDEWSADNGGRGGSGGRRTGERSGSGRRERGATEGKGAHGANKESKKKDKAKKRDSR